MTQLAALGKFGFNVPKAMAVFGANNLVASADRLDLRKLSNFGGMTSEKFELSSKVLKFDHFRRSDLRNLAIFGGLTSENFGGPTSENFRMSHLASIFFEIGRLLGYSAAQACTRDDSELSADPFS